VLTRRLNTEEVKLVEPVELVEQGWVDEPLPDPANVRKHNERNLTAIAASLRRFGQQKPIIIDGDNIVRAGNGTLAAAKKLGWQTIKCLHRAKRHGGRRLRRGDHPVAEGRSRAARNGRGRRLLEAD